MESLHLVGMVLIGLNVLISWMAFRNSLLFEKLLLRIGNIKAGQQYRLVTSAFVHADWSHLFFNLFSFFIFAGRLEEELGSVWFLILYFGSLLGGSLLAWLFHKDNNDYRAVGASGAVSGIVFAYIVMFPDEELSLMLLPFFFPAWIYGLLFIVYSIYGIRRQNDNIGHEAHLGGAITGLFITLALEPQLTESHPMTIIYLVVPSLAFLVVSFFKPQLLRWNFGDGTEEHTQDDRYREKKVQEEQELNRILEKVKHSGTDALSDAERRFLEDNF
jgi:membrane associated rhomboid family serine protease